jgi:hypothetical protein
MMLKFIEMSDFVRACDGKHDDARKMSCRTFSTVPKNQHSLRALTGAIRETMQRMARVPVHDVQDKSLRHPLIFKLVISDKHRRIIIDIV